jgi:hypothetical protein
MPLKNPLPSLRSELCRECVILSVGKKDLPVAERRNRSPVGEIVGLQHGR